MNWFLLILVLILLLAILWLSWRHILLRNSLKRYAALLHSIANGEKTVSDLPDDLPALEDFSNTVKGLALALRVRTSVVDAERARLAAVLDRMTDGVLIADSSGQVQFANPAIERLFDTKNALGRRVAEVLRQYQLVEAWQRSRDTGEPQEESVELPAHRRFLQLVVLPDQQTGGSLLLVQDLTRVRRLETVRRDFISNVSHELRTPLASLKALTETLRDGALEDPNAAPRFLRRIETEVDALTQMATELLELSRIESGQVPLEFKPVPATVLLLSAIERMRAQTERAGLVLRLDTAQAMTEVRADQPRLEQVLVNLIHNAVKFTPPGGEVILAAQTESDVVCFSVRDTGVGIPSDELERIFERFYKADRARSGGGTGLGLSISRHLVEAHGGRIWAESTEGQGSTF
jgi:two-component system, OmpR family, phosphate regulon sensor histidine kinase PhoR